MRMLFDRVDLRRCGRWLCQIGWQALPRNMPFFGHMAVSCLELRLRQAAATERK